MRRWLFLLAAGCGAPPATPGGADVVAVATSGGPGAYTFDVSVRSDETGCDQYADWWEVVTPAGELVYRRILNHSHPDEQPFTRDGGPVPVEADTPLIVRAHLHPRGFTGMAMEGTVDAGFVDVALEEGFAAALEDAPPLPEECWF